MRVAGAQVDSWTDPTDFLEKVARQMGRLLKVLRHPATARNVPPLTHPNPHGDWLLRRVFSGTLLQPLPHPLNFLPH